MKVNQGMVCPRGPHFPVSNEATLTAATYEILYKLISEWRMRNGIDPGDPETDVDNYICSQWPHVCKPTESDGAPIAMRERSLGSRVNAWAAVMVREQPQGGYKMVGEDVAIERAKKCLICPYNKAWVTCSNCARSALSLLLQLRKLRRIDIDNCLLGCEVCGHDNATAIHMQDYNPGDEAKKGLPQCCWIANKNI